MDIGEHFIDSDRLGIGAFDSDRPIALVDLDSARDAPATIALPPCPVAGVGDPAHPLAPLLDAVIVPPVTLDGLVRQVVANPHAAAVVTQVLRLLPSLAPDDGLVAESLAYATLQGSAEHARWLAGRSAMSAGEAGAVRLDRADDHLIVTLDRPGNGNAIDRTMRDALHEAFELAALDDTIARVSLRGAGKAFSLGAELAEFGTTRDPAFAHSIRQQTLPARMAARCADRLDAHVQGACVGAGLELAAWARRLTASPDAWFQLPELAMGVLPGAGGCVSLVRRIGRHKTALMVLSGKRLSARHALAWGLVDAVVDDPA